MPSRLQGSSPYISSCAFPTPLPHRLFRLSAEQGISAAQIRLAKLHLKGLGVPKDEDLATFWLGKAAEQGDEQAMKYLKEACSSSSDED